MKRFVFVALIVSAAACAKQEQSLQPSAVAPPTSEAAAAVPTAEAAAAAAVPTTEVGEAAEPAAQGTAGSARKRVEINVSMKGYAPATVALKKGEPVTLAFTRTENTNCGAEIQIASLKWKKELPMNTPVEFELTPDKAGEIIFACGMDMMHGILEVTE